MLKFVKRIICLLYFDIEVRKEKNVSQLFFFLFWLEYCWILLFGVFFLVQLVIFARFNMKFKYKVLFFFH